MIGYTLSDEIAEQPLVSEIAENVNSRQLTPLTTDEIRQEVLTYLKQNCQPGVKLELISSKIKEEFKSTKYRSADLTTVCHAINNVGWFERFGFQLKIVDAPPSGLGKVTYQAIKLS